MLQGISLLTFGIYHFYAIPVFCYPYIRNKVFPIPIVIAIGEWLQGSDICPQDGVFSEGIHRQALECGGVQHQRLPAHTCDHLRYHTE